MRLRFALPMVYKRGAGLGNEMILWGKAFIAAQALYLTALHPAWGLNPRRYYRYFGTSRADWFVHSALRATLPLVTFGEEEYLANGGGDLHDSLLAFGAAQALAQRSPLVVGLSGLWGGPGLLGAARDFLSTQLLSTPGTLSNLYKIGRRLGDDRIRIGMHIRRGDFLPPVEDSNYAGRFNIPVPFEWYEAIARSFVAAFGDRVSFLIASDASPKELAPLTSVIRCVQTTDLDNRDISDMMSLATCDFVVCSISSYSMWAAFFSKGRYAWFEPHLTDRGGLGSIWGHQETQHHPTSAIASAERDVAHMLARGETVIGRGVAIGLDGIVPDEVLTDIENRFRRRQRATDLIGYGVVPVTRRG